MMLHYDIQCPSCKIIIHIPFFKALEAKALEEYDMAELDAQTQLKWFQNASLWELLSYWRKRNYA